MLNTDNYMLFDLPNEADDWVWRIENGVGDWIACNNKSLWYVVLWESKRAGILKQSVTKMQFAQLLVQECPDALSEGETAEKIVESMGKYKGKDELKRINSLPHWSNVLKQVDEVSALLTCDVQHEESDNHFTLEQRMQEYLTMTTEKESLAKVIVRPIYEGKTPSMVVEKYVSQRFMDEHRPSHTAIFECVEGKVTEDNVDVIYGRYGSHKNTKIFIASDHPFTGGVKNEAERLGFGLILVNPQKRIDENCFVLPRSQWCQLPETEQWKQMLGGEVKMSVPMLVYDDQRIDDSLSFILYKYLSCDKKNLFVAVPYLSNAEIEKEALRLIQSQVDIFVAQLHACKPQDKVPNCIIDPYKIAEELGLSVKRGKTGKKLGHIDISQKIVTLSNRLNLDDPSDRYSISHEIGHYIFHGKIYEKVKDGVHTIVSRNKQWLEHHANYFASCLLMPAQVVRLLYEIYWKKEFKREEVEPLRLEADMYHDSKFQRVCGPVARKMNVSLQALSIRMKALGLLIEMA